MSDGKKKPSVTIVYTGEGKGKTSAGIGLVCRSLGRGHRVAFIQFIKAWQVSEHAFFASILPLYEDKFLLYKGGEGFYNAGNLSAPDITQAQHEASARRTFQRALDCVSTGEYQLVVCDEINNAVHDGLLNVDDMRALLQHRHPTTSLCLTGRYFPMELTASIDIISDMKQIRHHYDDGFLANEGIDY